MKIQSRPKHVDNDPMNQVWAELHRLGWIIGPPTPCRMECTKYALTKHRPVFFDLYPTGPWYCELCGVERKKNEVVVDHLDRIHNGFGSHNCPENLRPLCGKCNSARYKRNPKHHKVWGQQRMREDANKRWESAEERAKAAERMREFREQASLEELARIEELRVKGVRRVAGAHGRMHVQQGIVDETCHYCRQRGPRKRPG